MLKLFNSMGRRLQPFRPIEGNQVRMYTCGPTVWNYAHIGNFRTFVFEDVLRRYLRFKGFRVFQVMNITDVEDKIIKGMRQFGMTRKELSDFYERAFMEDSSTLNIERAEFYPRATEHIDEMVAMIQELLRKGYAYRAEDGSTYYDISKFRRYGRLSGIRPKQLRAGARVSQDHYEKREANDFALWKAWDEEDGDVFWETSLGKGRPGWSIECSAMSTKYLGDSFDIHTGGMDNKFPHHENEIAQSEAATGKRFVRFWLHSEFLNVRGEEMHKSVGNVVYLRDLLKEGRHPLSIRLFLLSARYRDRIDLTSGSFDQADAQRERIQGLVVRLRSLKEGSGGEGLAAGLLRDFTKAMDDDLNTPAALGGILSFVRKAHGLVDKGRLGREQADGILAALERIDSVLGVLSLGETKLPERLAALLERRNLARRKGDYAESDRLRAELSDEGIVLEDTSSGTVWKRVSGVNGANTGAQDQ